MLPSLPANAEHPWPSGHIFQSPGAHLTYRVVGPCCRLYDRDQLPWPCCRLQWRGKEPSWRRIGRRLIVDLSTRRHPSYCVEIVGQGYRSEAFVTTLYTAKLSPELQDWWHTKRRTVDNALASALPKLEPQIVASEVAEPALAYAASAQGMGDVVAAGAVMEPAAVESSVTAKLALELEVEADPAPNAEPKSAPLKSTQPPSAEPQKATDKTVSEPPSYPQLSLL